MRQFGHPPYHNRQNYPYYSGQMQQPFHPSPYYQPQQNYYQQPQTPFEAFAKPKQPQDWYTNNETQGDYQQAQQGMTSQIQGQNTQLNLDKVLTTVSQIANTYHQVSPIIKQFGDFMKTFR
ncbi:YppG family protein [Ornithinibacillus scapharcae]|uniref:YppG family protein n=1 Tax=Ornithinibacillus scapharcae TaxID=1147159 RepID=UPI000682141A|nr:YppG family protein [Ornithinibacillus scapharcae]